MLNKLIDRIFTFSFLLLFLKETLPLLCIRLKNLEHKTEPGYLIKVKHLIQVPYLNEHSFIFRIFVLNLISSRITLDILTASFPFHGADCS